MLFAILEIDSGTLRFVNAGHPPPLIVEQDGTTRILEGAGPPLGVMDTWRYEERVATLAPEMTAILYTDGLVERRGERLDTGLGRLRDAVAAGGSPEEMVDRRAGGHRRRRGRRRRDARRRARRGAAGAASRGCGSRPTPTRSSRCAG